MNDALEKIYQQNWVEYITTFPLAFAQVREDTRIDQWVVDQLAIGSQGIMIGSGGCTAVLLAHMEKFNRLTLVDMNPAQLALSQLKFFLVHHYNHLDRLAILGHQSLATHLRKNHLRDAFHYLQCDSEIFGPLDIVAELGPDHIGRYELLFKRLQHVIAHPEIINILMGMNSPEAQKQFLASHLPFFNHLSLAFQNVMSLPILVTLFGNAATQNAIMPFSEHFKQRTLKVINTLPAATNPYLSQLLTGQFTGSSVYPWLTLAKQSCDTEINYCLSTMADALLNSNEKYDFIHLSNILDWLNKAQASELLHLVAKRMNKDGWIIIRQLNSNLDIQGLHAGLHWETDLSQTLHKEDKSFFYQKLHLARML
jgi:S-adenosylmethionine-diacylglycerol 3-amino-3-carboxypropyl transferase